MTDKKNNQDDIREDNRVDIRENTEITSENNLLAFREDSRENTENIAEKSSERASERIDAEFEIIDSENNREKIDTYNTPDYILRVYRVIQRMGKRGDQYEYVGKFDGQNGFDIDTIPNNFGGGTYRLQYIDKHTGRIITQEYKSFSEASFGKPIIEKKPIDNNTEPVFKLYDELKNQINTLANGQSETQKEIQDILEILKHQYRNIQQTQPQIQANPSPENQMIVNFLEKEREREEKRNKRLEDELRELRKERTQKPISTSDKVEDFTKIFGTVSNVMLSGLSLQNSNSQVVNSNSDEEDDTIKKMERVEKIIKKGVDVANAVTGLEADGIVNMAGLVGDIMKGFTGKKSNTFSKAQGEEFMNEAFENIETTEEPIDVSVETLTDENEEIIEGEIIDED